jgi:isochorismate hydrolase
MSENKTNKVQVINEYVDVVWNQQRFESIGEFFHPDVKMLNLYDEPVFTGIDQLRQNIEKLLGMFEEAKLDVVQAISEDSRVAWQWRILGKLCSAEHMVGVVRKAAMSWPEFRDVVLIGITISKFEGSLIKEEINHSDMASLLMQMGYQLR